MKLLTIFFKRKTVKRLPILLGLVLNLFIAGSVFCAGPAVSVSGDPWNLDIKFDATRATTDGVNPHMGWIITGSSNGTEDIQIAVSSTGAWTPAPTDTAGLNQYVLKASPTSGGAATQVVTDTAADLVTGLAMNGTHNLNLALTTPTGGEEGLHTLAVTLTAKNWVPAAPTTACGTAYENNTATVICSSGTISSITFASYGTPSGTCGSFAQGSCHATSSSGVVSNLCLGLSQCSVPASNNYFGDPCEGTYKWLYIRVTCQ